MIIFYAGVPGDAGEQAADRGVEHGLPHDALPLRSQAVHGEHRGQRVPRGQAGRGRPQVSLRQKYFPKNINVFVFQVT